MNIHPPIKLLLLFEHKFVSIFDSTTSSYLKGQQLTGKVLIFASSSTFPLVIELRKIQIKNSIKNKRCEQDYTKTRNIKNFIRREKVE